MSQIQALDRTQPGLPLKKGRLGTMTHDYKRHGTTTLFAALNVLDGTVIGRNMQRHRHQEFMRFLNAIEAEVPAGKMVHVILDNYAAHKHPKVRAWLDRHVAARVASDGSLPQAWGFDLTQQNLARRGTKQPYRLFVVGRCPQRNEVRPVTFFAEDSALSSFKYIVCGNCR